MRHITLFICILTLHLTAVDQYPTGVNQFRRDSENRANLDSLKIKYRSARILFWNVENLYDPLNDTVKLDDEFTPEGMKHWNWSRFRVKLNNTAKTILAAGGWHPPDLVGLCEIENEYVLNRLIRDTPLARWRYRCIHRDSPDARGVDVALLYRPDRVSILSSRFLPVRFPFDSLAQTREIVAVKCLLNGSDTLVVVVNHWPSRRGGQAASAPKRMCAAAVLKNYSDSIFKSASPCPLLAMGDFNDEPGDASLELGLGAKTGILKPDDNQLFNLMGIRNRSTKEGTLKFREGWYTFDQFIISGSLLTGAHGLVTGPDQAKIFQPGFMLEEDNAYLGKRLNRTYAGPQYHGGFSDHLPIVIDLLRKKNAIIDPRLEKGGMTE